jgi:hypothetical protein
MSILLQRHQMRYSHIHRSASFLNSFHTLLHIVRDDRNSDCDFLLVGVVGMQGWREMVKLLDFLEGAVRVGFLEHVEVGLYDLLAGLGACGLWSYVLPSEDVFVKRHGSIEILGRNLGPGDGTGLFLVSGYRERFNLLSFGAVDRVDQTHWQMKRDWFNSQ